MRPHMFAVLLCAIFPLSCDVTSDVWDGIDAVIDSSAGHQFSQSSESLGLTLEKQNLPCGDRAQSHPPLELCVGGKIDHDIFRDLRDQLQIGTERVETLCQIDETLVHAQTTCEIPGQTDHTIEVGELRRLLAWGWTQKGYYERADQLYQAAYSAFEGRQNALLLRMAILKDWTNLKLISKQPERAKELVLMNISDARRELQSGFASKEFLTRQLIHALQFQATVFLKLGLFKEASTAETEAEHLLRELPPCNGICGDSGMRKLN